MKYLLTVLILLFSPGIHAWETPCDMDRFLTLVSDKRTGEAESLLSTCRKANPDAAFVHFGDGVLAMHNGKLDDAAEALEQAVNKDPQHARYHLWLGRAYGEMAGKAGIFKQAILAGKIRQSFERAVHLDPAYADARFDLMMYYLMAPGIAGGSDEKAEEMAVWLEQNDPPRGFQARFIMASKAKDFEKAILICRNAMSLQPENADWYVRIGAILVHQEKLPEAREHWTVALEKFPDNPIIRYQLGKTLLLMKRDLETAADCFATCAAMKDNIDDETRCWSNYRLGEVLEELKRIPEARNAYENALKVNPEMEEARKALKRLRKATG